MRRKKIWILELLGNGWEVDAMFLKYYSIELGWKRKRFYAFAEHVYAASVPIRRRVHTEEFGRQNHACATGNDIDMSEHVFNPKMRFSSISDRRM